MRSPSTVFTEWGEHPLESRLQPVEAQQKSLFRGREKGICFTQLTMVF